MLVEFAKRRIARMRNKASYSSNDLYTLGLNIIKENSDLDTEELIAWIQER